MDILLRMRVWIVRFLLRYNDFQERQQKPIPPTPAIIESITSPSPRGYVRLHFYTPPGFEASKTKEAIKHPIVIDFHGGGFSSGLPSMDARWAGALLQSPSRPVVVGVEYSLAPEHPFPAALHDAAAAIMWLAGEGAMKYDLDASRIVLSGFSAGGSLVLTSPLWMHHQGLLSRLPQPIRGIVSVYPKVSHGPRRETQDTNGWLSKFLTDTWDDAYWSRSPVESPFVCVGAADDVLLREALPLEIRLYSVANDVLMYACEDFRRRVALLGKHVGGDIETDAIHAWDKMAIKTGDVERWNKRREWYERMKKDVEEMLQMEE